MSSFNMFPAPHMLWSSKNTYTLYPHHHSPLCTSKVWLNSLACKVGWQVRKSSTGMQVTDHQWTNSAVSRGEPGWTLLGTKWATQGVHDSICLPMLYKDSLAIQALSDQSHYRHLSCEGNLNVLIEPVTKVTQLALLSLALFQRKEKQKF